MRIRVVPYYSLVATLGLTVGSAQQTVPFQGGIPVAPSGLAKRPLPDKPMEFDTARVSASASWS